MNKEKRQREKEQLDHVLHVENPFAHFEEKANHLGPLMGIKPNTIRATIGSLQATFGEDWLVEQTKKYLRGDVAPFCQHPLGNIFNVAGQVQITEALELAHYITALADVPRLDVVLANMKAEDEYETSLLQLGFAYRFMAVGAEEIEFEPPVADGRVGDIAFRFGENPYVAECYIPRTHPLLTKGAGELRNALRPILDFMRNEEGTHRIVMLRPKRQVTEQERKVIVGNVRQLIQDMGSDTTICHEDDRIQVEVRRVTAAQLSTYLPQLHLGNPEKLYDDAHACMTSDEVPFEALRDFHIKGTPPRTVIHKDVALVWAPTPTEPTNTVEGWANDLANKIGVKLAQARRADNPRRLVIVQIPSTITKMEGITDALKMIGNQLDRRHQNLGGVFVVSRITWSNSRHGYLSQFIKGNHEHALSPAILSKLDAFEVTRDITKPVVMLPINSGVKKRKLSLRGRRR